MPISAFCVWEIPNRGIAVHLHLSAVEWLDYEIRESLRAPEGAEVGGLLLGRIESKAWNKITIEGFTPVLCDYEAGSSYHLSQSDKDLLQEQLFRWQRGPGRNLYVVGFYRSHNREDFSLDGEDLSLAKQFFSDSAGVFLLIKPVGQRDRVGGLFLCDEGHVERECNLMFPFSRSRLTRGETTLDSFPESEEQDLPEGAGAPYFTPEENEFEPEAFAPKPSPRRGHPPDEEKEFEPEAFTPKPSPRRGHPPDEEKEFEPGADAPRPSLSRSHSTPAEKEVEPEASTPRPPPRRRHVASERKEFKPESDSTGPAARRSFSPLEEKELELEELRRPTELEFVPSQLPVFADFESETPRWRSWAGKLLVVILILVGGAFIYQLLRGSAIPGSLAGLLSSLGLGGDQGSKRTEIPGPQNADALGVKAELDRNSLRVSWNRDTPSIVTAKRGVLLIWDDDSRRKVPREVPVGADQLRTGTVTLSYETSPVAVRLQLIGTNGETVESARVTPVDGAAVSPSLAESTDRIPSIKVDPSPPRRARGSGTRGQAESSGGNRRPEVSNQSKLSLARATPGRTSQETSASSARGRTSPGTSASSTLPPPPVPSPGAVEQKPAETGAQRDEPQRLRPAVPEQGKPVPPPTEAAAAPSPGETAQRPAVEPPPKVTETPRKPDSSRTPQEQPPVPTSREPAKPAEKVSVSPAATPPATQPLDAPLTRADYVPPRAVRQVKPATPSNVRKLISEDTQINVRVEIDATGRVVRAEPVSTGKQDFLTSLAVEAARQWRFSPARQGDQNVSSSAVVGFQFKKD